MRYYLATSIFMPLTLRESPLGVPSGLLFLLITICGLLLFRRFILQQPFSF